LTEVADLTERDAITADRRREGMVVYVAADGQTYQLVGGVTNSDWTIFGNAAATLGSYVITVNGISGAVQLTPGAGIGIDSGLTFSVTGDYAFNSTVSNVSAGLYAIDVATSGELVSVIAATSASLFTLVVDTSSALQYEIDLAGTALADTSAALYAIDVATSGELYSITQAASSNLYSITQTASSALFTLVVDTSSALQYEINELTMATVVASGALYTLVGDTSAFLQGEMVAVSGDLYTLIAGTSAAIDGSFVHRLASGPSSEIIYNEKIFADSTTFNQDIVVQGAIFAASGVFAVVAGQVSAFDNMIELNVGDPGPGVTRGYAGVQVNRGSEAPYQFLFDENRNSFVIGTINGPVAIDGGANTISELQAVATREDSPIDKAIAVWSTNGDGSISPSGAYKFITNGNFTYDSVTGLTTNGIVYSPAVPADWSVAPTDVFEALNTLAADLTLSGSDLTNLIVATSGALHSEMVQTSGELYAAIVETSGTLYSISVAASSNLHSELVSVSGDLYTLTGGTSAVLQSEIDDISSVIVATSGNLYAIDVATSGELMAVIAATSGNLYSIDVATSAALYTLVGDTSGVLQSQIGDINTSLTDLYSIDVATSGNLMAVIAATSGDLYSIDVATSAALYTLVGDTSGVLQSQIDDISSIVVATSGNLMGVIAATSASLQTYTDSVSAAIVSNVVNMFEGGTVSCSTTAYGYTINHKTLNAISDAFPIVSLSVPTSSSVLYVQGITERSVSGFKVILSDVPDVAGFEINWVLFKPYFTTLP